MWPWIFQLLCSNTRICSNNLGPGRPEKKKKNRRLRTLLMLHHRIHICAGRWNGSSAAKIQWAVNTVSKQTCWKTQRTGRKGRLSLARSGVPSLGFYHSVCFSLLDALKIDAKRPSQWVPPSFSAPPPLEVLIRAAVTRLIVASRGQLSHSWAAHFMAGSQSWNKWAQYAWLEKLRPSCCCRFECLMLEAYSLLLLLQIQNIALVLCCVKVKWSCACLYFPARMLSNTAACVSRREQNTLVFIERNLQPH